jgi:hypothetical protein
MKNQFEAYGPTCAAGAFPSYRGDRIRARSFLLPTGGVNGIGRSASTRSAS